MAGRYAINFAITNAAVAASPPTTAVCQALREVGYSGTATVELDGGDLAYLRDVSRRFDKVLGG